MISSEKSNWICAQIGARENYAIARVLHARGRLACLYTDFWSDKVTRRASAMLPSKLLGALAGRYHYELADSTVVDWACCALIDELYSRCRLRAGLSKGSYHEFIRLGRAFSRKVARDLHNQRRVTDQTIYFTYDTGALEAFAEVRDAGGICLLGQMDIGRIEEDLVGEEYRRWPGWGLDPYQVPEAYHRRREREWEMADRVIVNSEFSRWALERQGVDARKITVIPLCSEYIASDERHDRTNERLQVLFMGRVNLRKGIQYLIQAARALQNCPVDIHVVGRILISREALAAAPANVHFHGHVNRSVTSEWYQNCDLFVFPTLADGFGLTQLEAMAHGLPVIATPHCGAVVRDGVDGFIVPVCDSAKLADAIRIFSDDRELLDLYSERSKARADSFTLQTVGDQLENMVGELRKT